MNTYTITIDSLTTLPESSFISAVEYTITGTDGTNSTSLPLTIRLHGNPQNLVPYKNLTEDMVIQWIAQRSQNFINEYANIDAVLASMKAPPVEYTEPALPWAK